MNSLFNMPPLSEVESESRINCPHSSPVGFDIDVTQALDTQTVKNSSLAQQGMCLLVIENRGISVRVHSCHTNHHSECLGNRFDEMTCQCHDGAVHPPCVSPHPEKACKHGDTFHHDPATLLNDRVLSKWLCDSCGPATKKATEDSDCVTMDSFDNRLSDVSHCSSKNVVCVTKVCVVSHEGIPCKHYGTVDEMTDGAITLVDHPS